MKFLIVSDIHGNSDLFNKIVKENSDVDGLFFLGDGMREFNIVMQSYPEIQVFAVNGNCDMPFYHSNSEQKTAVQAIEGYRIFYTHGDLYSVKTGFSNICIAAHDKNADIVLFGHTHVPCNEIISNLYLFNPGALARTSEEYSYGVMSLNADKKPEFKHFIVSFDRL